MSNFYIGVMSGTSLDGVDVALCKIDTNECKLVKSYEHPFDATLKEEILHSIKNRVSLKSLGELDVKLALLFSQAINTLLETTTIKKEAISAIGLHGQTLWHEPSSPYPFSMQLGNANVVAAQTGITTVADFRGADIANGGEGAPFAPLFHKELFAKEDETVAVINIGGMANISYLGEKFLGWDIGCGNVLMDTYIAQTKQKPYDKDGSFAKSGNVNIELLQQMLRDPYFLKEPPKSTGREYFNQEWLQRQLQNFQETPAADIQRTLLELSAVTIANAVNRLSCQKLILCGGGARNSFLVERIKNLAKCELHQTQEYGIDSDFLEAMLFAWLAYKRIQREEILLSPITGSTKALILGALYEA